MVNDLRDEMLNREIWRNIIREVSTAQKNKQLNNNNNTSTNSNTTTTAKRREGHQERELHRVMIFRQLKALPSEELESRIFKSGIIYIYIYITNTKQLCYYIINNYVYHELKNDV